MVLDLYTRCGHVAAHALWVGWVFENIAGHAVCCRQYRFSFSNHLLELPMETSSSKIAVNNDIYNTLGQRWYEADDDPVALLRAESKLHGPWIIDRLKCEGLGALTTKILDVGCGAGFKSNYLAEQGFDVTGIDLSSDSLAVARKYDKTGKVKYLEANAEHLPFADGSFDCVVAMDFLEHVEDPAAIIKEISRVLRPGGLFFFHTFNRNWFAGIVIIKLVEWFVANTPKHLHVLRLFVKPEEVAAGCSAAGLTVKEMQGVRPNLLNPKLLWTLVTGEVPRNFSFSFVRSTMVAYSGYSIKDATN